MVSDSKTSGGFRLAGEEVLAQESSLGSVGASVPLKQPLHRNAEA
jgi:hypothetical protein